MTRVIQSYKIKALIAMLCGSCVTSRYTDEYYSDPPALTDDFVTPTLVTAGNASNFTPDLSPNGAYVLYTSDRTGNKDIWEKKISRGFFTRLTFHTADDLSPVMDPEGEKFAFVSRRQDASGDIHIMELGGINFRSTSENESVAFNLKESEDAQPSWFPDGEKIVFTSRKTGQRDPNIVIGHIETLKTEILDIRGTHPMPSPDGSLIAYSYRGSLRLYDLAKKTSHTLTDRKNVQDGQPSFSPDGSMIYFIRYADDTNLDQKLNGDDRPAIYRIDLKKWTPGSEIPSLAALPITSSRFSSYYPKPKPPFLYLTMQAQDSLDIYSLPIEGHTILNYKDEVDLTKPSSIDPYDKAYHDRRINHILFMQGQMERLKESTIKQLFWNVQKNKIPEASNLYETIATTFSKDKTLLKLANLFLIKLKIQPLTYPDYRNEPVDELAVIIEKSRLATQSIMDSISPESPYYQDAKALSIIINTRINASNKKYFDALQSVQNGFKSLDPKPFISAESQLLIAELITDVMDRETAITRLVRVIEDNIKDTSIVKKASHKIIDVIKSSYKNPVEKLIVIKNTYPQLPWLAPIAHEEIVQHYLSVKNYDVAANELRSMMNSYTDNPTVAIDSALRLIKLSSSQAGYSQIDPDLINLYKFYKDMGNDQARKKALDALVVYSLQKGEALFREGKFLKSKGVYDAIIERDPLNINGHRGIIDCLVKLDKHQEALKLYESLTEKYPHSPEYKYLLGYAQTFYIDQENSPAGKLSWIEDIIEQVLYAKQKGSKIPQVHQTLGWLYIQKNFWTRKYYEDGGLWANILWRTDIFTDYFGFGDPNWTEMGIDSYQTAYFLAKPESYDQAQLSQNLGEAFLELKSFKRSLKYYVRRIKMLKSYPIRQPNIQALIIHKAAKVAFQLRELDLARGLFEKSLGIWETLGNDREISRNLDYLGLVSTDQNLPKLAESYYERLIKLHKRLNHPLNEAIATINLATSLFNQDRYMDSLEQFKNAEQLLNHEDIEIDIPDPEGIEIGMAGGQASETRGFTLLSRKIQIESYRTRILEKLGRKEMAIASWLTKIKLQIDKKEEGEDSGRSDLYYAEELSISFNNLGRIYESAGQLKKASEAYLRAYEWGQELHTDEKKVTPLKAEWLNLVNYGRSQLKRNQVAPLSPIELASTVGLLENVISHLKTQPVPRAKDTNEALVRLVPLKEQFHTKQEPNFDKISAAVETAVQSLQSERLAVNNILTMTLPQKSEGKIFPPSNQLKTLREFASTSSELGWKYYLSKKMWHSAYLRATSSDLESVSKHDLYILDRIFISLLSKEYFKNNEYQAICDHYTNRAKMLYQLAGFSHKSESIQEALKPKTIENITETLDEDYILTYIEASDKSGWLYLHSPDGITKSKVDALDESIKSILPELDENAHIYITANKKTFSANWKKILGNTATFSFISSPHSLPFISEDVTSEKLSIFELGEKKSGAIGIEDPVEYKFGQTIEQINPYSDLLFVSSNAYFNRYATSHTNIKLTSHPSFDNIFLSNFDFPELDRLDTIIYASAELDTDQESTLFEPWEVYLTSHLATIKATASTSIFNPKPEQNLKSWRQPLLQMQGKSLVRYANEKNFLVFGMKGAEEPDQETMIEELTTNMEDEAYREAFFIARQLNKEDQYNPIVEGLRDQSQSEGEFKHALYFQEKLISRTEDKESVEHAENLQIAGILSVKTEEYEKAASYFKKANKIFLEDEDFSQAGLTVRYLGTTYERQKKYTEAVEALKTSRSYYLKDEDEENAARRLMDIGNLYNLYFSDYIKALEYYDEAIKAFKDQENDADLSRVAIDKANTLKVVGRVDESINILENLLKDLGEPTDETRVQWIRTAQILSVSYFRANQYEETKELNKKTIRQIGFLEDGRTKTSLNLDATNITGMVEAKTGDFVKAVKIFEDGVTEASKFQMSSKIAQRYNNLGFWHREKGYYKKSITYLEKALAIDQKLESESSIAYDYRNLGLSLALRGNLKQAIDYLEKSLDLSLKLKLAYNTAYTHFGLGDIYLKQKKWAEAIQQFKQVLAISKRSMLPDFTWRSLTAIGHTYNLADKPKSAMKYLKNAIVEIEKQRPGQKTDRSKTNLQSDIGIHQTYQEYVTLLMADGQIEKAWEFNEKSRARGLIDILSSQSIDIKSDEKAKFLDQARGYRREMTAIERNLSSLEKDSVEYKKTVDTYKATRSEYWKLLAQMKDKFPSLMFFIDSRSIKLTQLQSHLVANQKIVEYMVTDHNLHIWVISDSNISGLSIEISSKELQKKIGTLQELLKAYSTTKYLSAEISEILIKPIEEMIQGSKSITIIPHSFLNHVSFALLPYQDQLLVDVFPIRYLESATLLDSLPKNTLKAPPEVLALGNPSQPEYNLPFAEKEVQVIQRYISNAMVYTQEAATKEVLLANITNNNIVHIASHAEFNQASPSKSFLLLSGESPQSHLTVHDTFKLKLDHDMVVLSGCETGLGNLSNGDEVISFNRAFFYAGTRSILSSLWRINDVTSAVIMKRFYRYLAEGDSKDIALQKAQILLKKYHPHPSYWAAYRLLGKI